MAFVQVGNAPIIKLENYKPGDLILEGVYVGSFDTKFGKPAFKFRESNGTVRAISCGALQYKMSTIEKGTLCRVVYLNKGIVANGLYKGKVFHDVDLMIDDTSLDTAAVAAAEAQEDDVY